jgi:hypothetical protein
MKVDVREINCMVLTDFNWPNMGSSNGKFSSRRDHNNYRQTLATGRTVRRSNPGGGARFFAPVQTVPGTHSTSYTMNTGLFPGGKRPRCGVNHPPHLAPKLKKE